MAAVKHILRYASGTLSFGCHYAKERDEKPQLASMVIVTWWAMLMTQEHYGSRLLSQSKFDHLGVTEAKGSGTIVLRGGVHYCNNDCVSRYMAQPFIS